MIKPVIPFHQDYADILTLLNSHGCSYVVVGAYAMSVYGYIRMTGDIDILVNPEPDNAGRVYSALKEFGAPLADVRPDDFAKPGLIYQVGVSPVRVDIITAIDGVKTDYAIATAAVFEKEGIRIPFLSMENIIQNKISTGRKKDSVDAEEFQLFIRGKEI